MACFCRCTSTPGPVGRDRRQHVTSRNGLDQGISTKDDLNIQDDVIKRQIDFGMEKAAKDPFPSKETLSEGVYKTADHPWTYLS